MPYNEELRHKTKQDFVKYLEEHPDERLWQAISNFSGVNYVLACDRFQYSAPQTLDIEWVDPKDTFYWEGKDG